MSLKHLVVVRCLTRVWPVIRQNDAFDGFNHRRLWDARIGEGCVNLGELVRVDVGISRTLGLKQKPAHAAVATQRTNSLQLLRQIDCRCTVINTEEVTGQTIAPIFGELTNLGDGIEPPESFNLCPQNYSHRVLPGTSGL